MSSRSGQAGLVVTPAGVLRRDLLVVDDRIVDLALPGTATGADWQEHDASGKLLFPGMIDLLQHGFDVNLYSDATPDGVPDSAAKLPARGVTGFLPSIGCQPPAAFGSILTRLADACERAEGARALGIHSEGPCFNSPGAHNPQNLQLPSAELAAMMLDSAKGRLAAVTIAPELPGAEEFIRIMKAEGVSIHFGHSQAAPDDVSRYVSWGIDAVTHMYDVMRTLPPDNSGVHVFSLPDALMAERHLALGVVADGIHAHPKLLRILAQLPADRVFLETDSMKYAGLPGTGVRVLSGLFRHQRAGQGGARSQWRALRFVFDVGRGHAQLCLDGRRRPRAGGAGREPRAGASHRPGGGHGQHREGQARRLRAARPGGPVGPRDHHRWTVIP